MAGSCENARWKRHDVAVRQLLFQMSAAANGWTATSTALRTPDHVVTMAQVRLRLLWSWRRKEEIDEMCGVVSQA